MRLYLQKDLCHCINCKFSEEPFIRLNFVPSLSTYRKDILPENKSMHKQYARKAHKAPASKMICFFLSSPKGTHCYSVNWQEKNNFTSSNWSTSALLPSRKPSHGHHARNMHQRSAPQKKTAAKTQPLIPQISKGSRIVSNTPHLGQLSLISFDKRNPSTKQCNTFRFGRKSAIQQTACALSTFAHPPAWLNLHSKASGFQWRFLQCGTRC